ncbi:E3 SUMO-protein ligase ZBED1-like [Polypterus senegalus]|uniref:E3 SUMO-protein ligase ZBED1-like n=1 Tax=Polypterus senegalus TaxID=55291 RepID=UPI001963FAA6|nr:E3 SUMO-protein ligase ZBED1-like [Polypterus senegalus]
MTSPQNESAKKVKLYTPLGFKSTVWKYFGFRKKEGKIDKTHATCNECQMNIKYHSNTTNLASHLKRKHGLDLAATASVKVPSPQESPTVSNIFPQTLSANSKRASSITGAISKFIAKDLRPYSVIENDGFRELIHTLEPKYVMPYRQHFSEKCIPRLFEQVKDSVKEDLDTAEGFAISTDRWTSLSTDSYVTVTCHFIDSDWCLKNYVLQTRALNEAHSDKNLGALLKETCIEWGIGGKKTALVTDDASNASLAGIEADISPRIMCFAHTVNSATQKGLKCDSAERVLDKVRRIVAFFRRSPTGSAILLDKQKCLAIPEHQLISDVVTRWISTYDMLQRFLEQQSAVCASLLEKQLRKVSSDLYSLEPNDITAAEEIVKVLEPVKTAATIMCDENQPTLSVIAPLLAKLLDHFKISEDDSAIVREMKHAMVKDLRDSFLDLQLILNKATALDPRFKKLPYLSQEEREATFESLISEAETLWHKKDASEIQEPVKQTSNASPLDTTSETVSQPEAPGEEYISPPKKTKTLTDLFGDDFCTADPYQSMKSCRQMAHAEVLKYRETKSLILSGNALYWWKGHQSDFPLLAKLAKTYLCIPGTSVPSEWVFSTAGDILNSQRSVLSPEHMDQLIFLKKNL